MTHPYAGEAYARAFAGVAEPVELPASGTWVLARSIPGSGRKDLTGCYPRSAVPPDADLSADFAALRAAGFVSLTLATDVFVHPEAAVLGELFDVCVPFKQHYVLDWARPFAYTKHHRYEVSRALRHCAVQAVELTQHMDKWIGLYRTLVRRRHVTGLANFGDDYFAALAELDGLVATAALHKGEIVGMHLWLVYEKWVYSHLGASSEAGYRVGASYALYDDVINRFQNTHCIDFGGAPGTTDNAQDGLARFKRGFANTSAVSYLCGKILDPDTYYALCPPGRDAGSFFPAYRMAGSSHTAGAANDEHDDP